MSYDDNSGPSSPQARMAQVFAVGKAHRAEQDALDAINKGNQTVLDANGNEIKEPDYVPDNVPVVVASNEAGQEAFDEQVLNYTQSVRLKMSTELLKGGPLPKNRADVMALQMVLTDMDRQSLSRLKMKQDAKEGNAHIALASAILTSLTGKNMADMTVKSKAPIESNTEVPSIGNHSSHVSNEEEMRTQERPQTFAQFKQKRARHHEGE